MGGFVRTIAAWLAITGCGCVSAQPATPWPAQPLRLLAGFSPGGNADTSARIYAGEISKRLGQTIVVDNRAGAAGIIAATTVAKAAPDGNTLLWATGAHPATGALHAPLPYDTVKSFAFVSVAIEFPFVIAVRADSPHRSIGALIAAGKDPGNKITYSTSGIGTTHHLTTEYLQSLTGTRFLHVPYKGGALSVLALTTGEVQIAVSSPLDIAPQTLAGKMRSLAVTSRTRNARLPDTPTLDESGVKGFDVSTWNGLAAPAGTPRAVVNRLAQEMQRAAQLPELRQTIDKLGSDAVSSTPEELQNRVTIELARWTKIVREKQIKPQ